VTESIDCYDVPQYWDLAFDEDTVLEADFVEATVNKYCNFPLTSVYEPGCGGGRIVLELASRGHAVTGVDLSSSAIEFLKTRLDNAELTADVRVADMRSFQTAEPVDVACCFVNTFRHLLTEEDAVRHLQAVARSVRPGGLYLLGMHLLPPDADEEDSEDWSITQGDVTVDMRLDVAECSRANRQEVLRFKMDVSDPQHPAPQTYTADYRMRIYEAGDMLTLLSKVPDFKLIDVYDFWYDIEEPLTLSDEMGDTVFVLQRQETPDSNYV